jgi:transcriptional regulator
MMPSHFLPNINCSLEKRMYIPPAYTEIDAALLRDFISSHSFATLITVKENAPHATHLNLIIDSIDNDPLTLFGHLAKANPQANMLQQNTSAHAIFLGDHAYISPSCYQNNGVPTWNYTVVHAHGVIELVDDKKELQRCLDKLIAQYESVRAKPWCMSWENNSAAKLLDFIVGFKLTAVRLEGKFKLSQDKSLADQARVIHDLENSLSHTDQSVGALMRANAAKKK